MGETHPVAVNTAALLLVADGGPELEGAEDLSHAVQEDVVPVENTRLDDDDRDDDVHDDLVGLRPQMVDCSKLIEDPWTALEDLDEHLLFEVLRDL